MKQDDFEKMMLAKPAYVAAAGDEANRKAAFGGYVQAAIDRIALSHDFNWSTRRAVVTGGSVIGDATYPCNGESDDAGYISSVLYGDLPNLRRLEIKQHDEIDRMIGDGYTFNGVQYWLDEMGVNVPQIRLVDTPTEAGKTIKYVYRKKGVTIEGFPDFHVAELIDVFMWVFADSYKTDSGVIISTNFERKGKEAIGRMIAATDKGRAGRRPTPLGTAVVNANIRRNRLHGYGND